MMPITTAANILSFMSLDSGNSYLFLAAEEAPEASPVAAFVCRGCLDRSSDLE